MAKIYTTWLTGLVYEPHDENAIHVVDKQYGEFTNPEAAKRQIEFFLQPGNFPYIIKDIPIEPGLRFQIEEEDDRTDCLDTRVLKTFYINDYV